jgi:hypothetical protein
MMSPASAIGAGGLARVVALRVRLAQGLTGFAVVAGLWEAARVTGILKSAAAPSAAQFVSALSTSLHDGALAATGATLEAWAVTLLLSAAFESILGNAVPTGGYVSTTEWLNANKETVAAFDKAIAEATRYINADPAGAAQIINAATKTPAAIAKLVVFPEFVSKLSDASLQTQISQARSVGILGTNVSASSQFCQ